jgi:hypothetical protein
MSRIACATPTCGHVICLDPETEARFRRTHANFLCPAGHGTYFPEKTDEERQIEFLQGMLNRARRQADEYRDESLRCPWPTCRSHVYARRDVMWRHMQQEHGMPTLAAVRAEESA